MALWWIGVAYIFGMLARQVGQPPLVGYLVAGLMLELVGYTADDGLAALSEIGIHLLLFVIGLKLDLRTIARREVWGVTLLHMALTTGLIGGIVLALSSLDLPLVGGMDLRGAALIGFAASFSSTVFVVKLLEDRGDVTSFYGRVAVGALIVQDVAAVVFLGASDGKIPSPWALGLLGLYFARPLVHRFLSWSGHGEVLVLAGLALTMGGASLFEVVGMKGDLGALALGLVAAGHVKSSELGKAVNDFKDIFLVTFFLSVGLTGLPTPETVSIALALVALAPLKALLFFVLFARFDLRARSSLMASASLLNFSEFGLIVAAVSVGKGWLSPDWMVALALAVGGSFLMSALVNGRVYDAYTRWRGALHRFERTQRLPEERPVSVPGARALVFGMGRVGSAAYDTLRERYGDGVVGIDVDDGKLARHQEAGRRVVRGSATDADFWDRLQIDRKDIELVLLATASQTDHLTALHLLREAGYEALLAVTARYPDDVAALKEAGADLAVHVFAEAGHGCARDVLDRLGSADRPAAGT